MTRGLGGPRVENDGRGREAEGGLSAPVAGKTRPRRQRFLGMQKMAAQGTPNATFAACGRAVDELSIAPSRVGTRVRLPNPASETSAAGL
jgi:hypothetical protein